MPLVIKAPPATAVASAPAPTITITERDEPLNLTRMAEFGGLAFTVVNAFGGRTAGAVAGIAVAGLDYCAQRFKVTPYR